MMFQAQTVFLLDVDNSLFDDDRFAAQLGARLGADFGRAKRDRYRASYGRRVGGGSTQTDAPQSRGV